MNTRLDVPSLRFSKTGLEIKKALVGRINHYKNYLEDVKIKTNNPHGASVRDIGTWIYELQTVYNHIDPNRSFDLTLADLIDLGFGGND